MNTTFHHCNLDVQIYMEQYKGFRDTGHDILVCKLKMSWYGLNNPPRKWYTHFDPYMLHIDYISCEYECCVYVRSLDDSSFIFRLLMLVIFD